MLCRRPCGVNLMAGIRWVSHAKMYSHSCLRPTAETVCDTELTAMDVARSFLCNR